MAKRKNKKDKGLTLVGKPKKSVEGKRTVTLKLSKEDHDLLIPNLSGNLAALKILYEDMEERKEWEGEGRENERAWEEEKERRDLEWKKKNLKNLSAREKEWLQNCLNGEESFWCFKEGLQYLENKIQICIDMAKVAQHFITELDVCPSMKLPFKAMVDVIEDELDCQHGLLEDQLERWGTPPEDEEGTAPA